MRKTSSIRLILSATLCWAIFCSANTVATGKPREATANTSTNSIPAQTPDLKWQPHPFEFTPGHEPRFIDYRDGNDNNPGTRHSPWKHHPWDKRATDLAVSEKGIDTFVFKKGVTYRGSLVASESGTLENPIHLTVDPSWGTGDALISGSTEVTSGWASCKPAEAALLPVVSRKKTWCTTIRSPEAPNHLWEHHNDELLRIPIARHPNWEIDNPDDPRSGWLDLKDVVLEIQLSLSNSHLFSVGENVRPVTNSGSLKSDSSYRIIKIENNNILVESYNWKKGDLRKGTLITNGTTQAVVSDIWGTHDLLRRLIDPDNLLMAQLGNLTGAIVWSESSNIPKTYAAVVSSHDQTEGSITANFHLSGDAGPAKYTRYYMEGLPQFLDSNGEYFFKNISGDSWRLFLRLPEDRNPNSSAIELSEKRKLLEIRNKQNIEISGVQFGLSNQASIGTWDALYAPTKASAILIRGNSSNIHIHHCGFHNLAAGIVALPNETGKANILDKITITDSVFHNIDGSAIALSNGRHHSKIKHSGSRLIHTSVLRNNMENIGYRTLGHWAAGSLGHGIEVTGSELSEVAYNHTNLVWGSGISLYLGTDYQNGEVSMPLLRGLIHHNKVTNSVLGLQDYGGIASWHGGPLYIYNNISGNPVGYKHEHDRLYNKKDWHRRSSYGLGIYLDGQYKGYVFNNIVWGKNNDVSDHIYNAGAIKEATGFMNTIFNNTLFNFGVGLDKDMRQHNRDYYIGNRIVAVGDKFIHQLIRPDLIEYRTLAFTRNLFEGSPPAFGLLGHTGGKYTYKTLPSWKEGMLKHSMFVSDTGTHLTTGDISKTGVLNFYPKNKSAAIDHGAKVFVPWSLYGVIGEWHFFSNKESPERIPGESVYMDSRWVKRSMFQTIPRNDLVCKNISTADYNDGILEDWVPGALTFNGKDQYCESQLTIYKNNRARKFKQGGTAPSKTASKNILLETVIQIPKFHTNTPIANKEGSAGYSLSLDAQGHIRMSINANNTHIGRTSSIAINDGSWHHIIAEYNHSLPYGINIYIDGRLLNGAWTGEDLIDPEDFSHRRHILIGRSDDRYFRGAIDFLRISTGTLESADTTIEQLYDWQFQGPSLKDFSGERTTGSRRDIGAVEYMKN